MKEELISLDLANLAKEKGFDQKSCDQGYIISTGELSYDYSIDYCNGKAIAAPTQSLLQKWLRDIHNIDVQPYLVEYFKNEFPVEQQISEKEYLFHILVKGININVHHILTIKKSNINLTYELALEEGLKQALRLI